MSGPGGVEEVVLDGVPALGPLYARAVAGLAVPAGRRPRELPRRAVVLRGAAVGVERAAALARVTGADQRAVLPLTGPHLLAFAAQVHLMAAGPFPFALPGLVHVGQRVVRSRAVGVTERLDVRVEAVALGEHPRGRTVDLLARVEAAGEPVWEGVSTYLHREQRPEPRAEGGSRGAPSGLLAGAPGPDDALVARWRVPASAGRGYAAVSGDANPIHTSRAAARALGFPGRIAHGMWTLARALAPLEPRLPQAAALDVAFGSPLLLGATAQVHLRPAPTGTGVGADGGFDLAVRTGPPSTGRLHLAAALRPVPQGSSRWSTAEVTAP